MTINWGACTEEQLLGAEREWAGFLSYYLGYLVGERLLNGRALAPEEYLHARELVEMGRAQLRDIETEMLAREEVLR